MGKTVKNNYVQYTHERGNDFRHGYGDFRFWINKPLIDYKFDLQGYYWEFTLKINDYTYFDKYDPGDDYDFSQGDSIYPTANFSGGWSSPNWIFDIDSNMWETPVWGDFSPVLPYNSIIDDLTTPTSPQGYQHHTTTKIYHKFGNNQAIPLDWEYWATDIAVDYVDNLFNSRKPVFTVMNPATNNKYVQIKMESNYDAGNNITGSLPRLVRADIGEDYGTTLTDADYVAYNPSTLIYQLPWDEGTERYYRLETLLPEFSDDVEDTDGLTTSVKTVDMFNDDLYFTTAQLDAPSGLSRSGRSLTWNAVTNAKGYTIFVDGSEYATVSTNSYTIPESLYNDEVHSYSVRTNGGVDTDYKVQMIQGWRSPDSSKKNQSFPGKRITKFKIFGQSSTSTDSSWTNIGAITTPTLTYTMVDRNKYTVSFAGAGSFANTSYYYKRDGGTLTALTGSSLTLENLTVNTAVKIEGYIGIVKGSNTIYSSAATIEFTPTKYPAPTINSTYTKTAINAYEIKFSSTTTPNRYDVFLNGKLFRRNATSPLTVSGLTCNAANTIKVESVFEADNGYNNSRTITLAASYTPALTSPTLTSTDVKENNYTDESGFIFV